MGTILYDILVFICSAIYVLCVISIPIWAIIIISSLIKDSFKHKELLRGSSGWWPGSPIW